MKKNIFYLFIFVFSGSIAQNSAIPILEREINLSVENEPLKGILAKIENQGLFNFSYNSKIIDENKSYSFSVKNKTVRDVLNQLFGDDVKYKQKGNYLILIKKAQVPSKEKKTDLVISGYVYDKNNGQKLKDVTLYEKKSLLSTITNQYGYFSIEIPREQSEIILFVKKEEYEDTIIVIKPISNQYVNINISHSVGDTIAFVNKEMADSLKNEVERLSIVNLFLTERLRSNTRNLFSDTLLRKFQISLLPFVSTNNFLGGNIVNDYSFNVIAGYSQGVNKMELGGILNIDRSNVKSLQLAGVGNIVGGNVLGFQGAGLMNFNYGKTNGLQAAGFMNLNIDSLKGVQLAGFMNTQIKSFKGLQAAGFMNTTIGKSKGAEFAGVMNTQIKQFEGIQAAGFMNVAVDSMKGVQIAGFCNHNIIDFEGLQLAGFYNVSVKKMDGIQISGFINYAQKVKGTQIAFLNISDTCDGIPFGFLSFVNKGYHKIELSYDEVLNANIAFRTGVNKFHNVFSAGILLPELNKPLWSFGYGIGSSFIMKPKLLLDIDLTSSQVVNDTDIGVISLMNRLYVGMEYKVAKKLSIAAGPHLNVYLADMKYKNYNSTFSNILPSYFFSQTFDNQINLKMSVGGKLALRFL